MGTESRLRRRHEGVKKTELERLRSGHLVVSFPQKREWQSQWGRGRKEARNEFDEPAGFWPGSRTPRGTSPEEIGLEIQLDFRRPWSYRLSRLRSLSVTDLGFPRSSTPKPLPAKRVSALG